MSTAPTLAGLYAQCLRHNPDNIAVIEGEREYDYRELADHVGRLLAYFDDLGIRPGHRLGVCAPMSFDFLALYVACHVGGITISDLPPALPDQLLIHRAESAKLDTLVLDPASFDADRTAGLRSALPAAFLATTAAHGLPGIREGAAALAPTSVVARPAPDFAAINYSGGTTGRPKAEGISAAASAALPMMLMASVAYPERPVSIAYRTSAPVLGCNVAPTLLRGGTVVTLPDFDLAAIIDLTVRHRANLMFIATRALYELAEHADADKLRGIMELVFHGGDHLVPARIIQLRQQFGPIFAQCYGCSETGQAAMLAPEDHDPERPDVLQSVGKAMIGVEFSIRGQDGSSLPPGEVGEIAIRSPAAMTEYLGLPEKTAETIRDGWVHTGDAGWMDADGYLRIVDRISNSFLSGGKRVYPAQVDALACEHPAISGAVTVGMPGVGDEAEPVIAVVLKAGGTASASELEAFVLSRGLAAEVRILTEFPLLPAQLKVDRLRLKEMLQESVRETSAVS